MDKLPPEIWHRIFIQLELEYRLRCTLVCRHWRNILDKYSLFYDVEIMYNTKPFNKFMELIKRLPHRANQVEELWLLTCLDPSFNKRTLLNIFPNVRILKVEFDQEPEDAEEYSYFSEPIKCTKSKIKVLSDSIYCELASQMLTSKLCGRLEKLKLDFCEIYVTTRILLNQLKDLPVLKELTLSSIDLGMIDIENLHSNLPNIQELKLDYIRVIPSETPSNIQVVTLPTALRIKIFRAEEPESLAQFYKYLTKKYTSVDQHYDDIINYYTPWEAKEVYLNGLLDFLRIVKQDKKNLKIYSVHDGVDVFEIFDDMDCQCEDLYAYNCGGDTFFQYLAQSNQSKYIQEMTLNNTTIDSPHHLRNMMALTTLHLDFYLDDDDERSSINLTDCLNGFPPTLKTLCIERADITVNPFTTHFSPIETLTIHCKYIPSDLGIVISTCFPKLTSLEIKGRFSDDLHISLQNHPLLRATLSLHHLGDIGISFKSPSQPEPQFYRYSKEKRECVSYEEIDYLPIFSFVTFTEKTLEFFSSDIVISPA